MLAPLSCSEPAKAYEPGRAAEGLAASVADTLRAVCREVADAGQAACDLQATLSGFAPVPGQQDRAIEALQALDLLTQRLGGVAAFLDALTPTLPTRWTCNAAAAARVVTLSDLAHRLGRPQDECRHAEKEDAGALELFGTDDA